MLARFYVPVSDSSVLSHCRQAEYIREGERECGLNVCMFSSYYFSMCDFSLDMQGSFDRGAEKGLCADTGQDTFGEHSAA